MVKQRKIPQRKCVATNELKPKKDMIRIVRNKDKEVFIDPTGKQNGRGAYLTMEESVIRKAEEQKILEKTFQVQIDASLYEELIKLASDKSV